ncbi:MAG: HlyD family secretion protein, partial [Terracidiphilus sp.]
MLVNPRNRVFLILGVLAVGSLIFYLVTVPRSKDIQLIGTVDANEVVVSSKIPGRIQKLTVVEGQKVQAGELIAVIESRDLKAALQAAQATAASDQWKLSEAQETVRQNRGETSSAAVASEAQVRTAQASLAQAEAAYRHQEADTSRDVKLAGMGIVSAQTKDEEVASLQQAKAAVDAAQQSLSAAQGSLRQARAHELLTTVSARTADETRDELKSAVALAGEAQVEESYSRIDAPTS